MRSFAPLAFAAVAAALPGGAPDNLKPAGGSPPGCKDTYSGTFGINTVNVTSGKRSLEKRAAAVFTLSGGILKDSQGRIADVVANNQFQFDGPPAQAGAKYDAGFSICPNNTLALGPSTLFDACLSGEFYNIYFGNKAPQCHPVYIEIIPNGGSAPSGPAPSGSAPSTGKGATNEKPDGQPTSGPGASQISDGQIQFPTKAAASQIGDGQVQAPTKAAGASQIGDGQVQAPTKAASASQISDGQVQAPTKAAGASQISDGQVQAPTKAAGASQISDGQVQAPTKAAGASQIADGQVQAPTKAAGASQIADGQVQAPTKAASASQISDGQVQAPKASQIADGQVQAPKNGTTPPTQVTSSGVAVRGDLFALFGAGLMAVLLL